MSDTEGPRLPNEKEIAELPRESQVVFAARCALRTFPLLGVYGQFDFWGENTEGHLHSLWAALLASVTADNALRACADAADAAGSDVDPDDEGKNTIVYAASYACAEAAWTAYDFLATEASPAGAAAQTLEFASSAASYSEESKALFARATVEDYEMLLRDERALFQRPLMGSQEIPLENWLFSELGKAFESVGAGDLLNMWISFFHGEPDLEACQAWLGEWKSRNEIPDESSDSQPIERRKQKERRAGKDVSEKPTQKDPEAGSSENKPQETPSDVANAGIPAGSADGPAGEDALGRDSLVRSLANMLSIEAQGTPITLALFGHWGAGKSSVMRLLQKELSSEETKHKYTDFDFLFGWFNAWEYEHTDDIRAGLAQEVVNGLLSNGQYAPDSPGYAKKMPRLQKLWLQLRYLLGEKPKESIFLMLKLSMTVLAGVLGLGGVVASSSESVREVMVFSLSGGLASTDPVAGIAVTHEVAPDDDPGDAPAMPDFWTILSEFIINPGAGGQILGTGGLLLSAILCFRWFPEIKRLWDHPLATDLGTFFKLPSYREELGQIPVIRKQLEGLCKIRLNDSSKKAKRLVIFIDDLDRCQTDKIAETFDAARLIAHIPGVILVIGIDERIAFKAMGHTYEDYADDVSGRQPEDVARDYLGKIIQVPVRLESPSIGELRGFIEKKLFEDAVQPAAPNAEPSPDDPEPDDPKPKDPKSDGGKGSGPGLRIENEPVLDAAERTRRKQREADRSADERTKMVETPDEMQHFIALCHIFDFNNPRQLLRLKNTYRLLKDLYRGRREIEEAGYFPSEPLNLLRMLFWLEFKLQSAHEAVVQWVESEKASEDPSLKPYYAAFDREFMKPEWIQGHWVFTAESFQNLEDFTRSCLLPYPSREKHLGVNS